MYAIILASTLFWPWHVPVHKHHRLVPPATTPDCSEINTAVKGMGPARYESALKKATKEQQKIITNCEAQPW